METSSPASSENWPSSSSGYELRARIGQGYFSEVWSALTRSNNLKVAIKIMDLENVTSLEDVLREVQVMRLQYHANILNCYSSILTGDKIWIVTKLMDIGSCKRLLRVSREMGLGEGLTEEVIGYVIAETLKGLEYLHNRGHIHREIQSGNILVDSHGVVKLADFGALQAVISAERSQHGTAVPSSPSSLFFASPETIENGDVVDNKTDVWSLGITVLELAKGLPPYTDLDPATVQTRIVENEPPNLLTYLGDIQTTDDVQSGFSKFYEDFYRKALQKNPKLRPSIAELLKHKFVRSRSKTEFIEWISQVAPIEHGISAVTSAALTSNSLSRRDSSDADAEDINSQQQRKSENSQSLLTLQLKQSSSPPLLSSTKASPSSLKDQFRSISSSGDLVSSHHNNDNSNNANNFSSNNSSAPNSNGRISNNGLRSVSHGDQDAQDDDNNPSNPQDLQPNEQFIPGTSWIFDSLSSDHLASLIGQQTSESSDNLAAQATLDNKDGQTIADEEDVVLEGLVGQEENVFDCL